MSRVSVAREYREALASGDLAETTGMAMIPLVGNSGITHGLICRRCNSVAWNTYKAASFTFRAAMLDHLRACVAAPASPEPK